MKHANELLLCGSGLPAFAHIGVLKALSERGAKISTVTGSSTGSLVAALHANGVSSSVIQDLFLDRLPQRFNAADWLGVRDQCQATPRMFCPVVDLEPIARQFVRANGLKPQPGLRIVAYDLLSNKPVVFTGNQYDLALALAASCAVPGISRPVRTGQWVLVDIATHEWQIESHCAKHAIISRAAYDDNEGLLTQLDSWLRQRRHLLHVPECTSLKCCEAEHIVVTTMLHGEDDCACAQSTAAGEAAIAAGYETACRRFDAE